MKIINLTLVLISMALFVSSCSQKQSSEFSSDLAIVTADGHPAYYDSTVDAHKIWDGVEKNKIVFADSFDKYTDKTIINMSDDKDGIITQIEIYFQNFTPPIDITLEESLKIASEYIPYDIINEWYEFNRSYCIKPISPTHSKDTYYVVSYNLTENGKKAYKSHKHSYSGSIDIIFEENMKGNIINFTIGFGTPRWMSSLNTNDYEEINWNCNLNDIK